MKIEKEAIVIFGRMNPITKAHCAMIEEASRKGPTLVYLSHSQNNKKDPLPYDRKIYWARKSLGPLSKCIVESDAARLIEEVLPEVNQSYDRICFMSGPDRSETMENLIKSYNGKPDRAGTIHYQFSAIRFGQFGQSRSGEGLSGISATRARNAAKNNDFDEFRQMVNLDENDAKRLFYELQDYMK